MAAGSFQWYNAGKEAAFTNTLASTDIAVVLLGAGYTPDATHSTYADISGSEITDADYAQQSLANATYSQSSGTVELDADSVSFGSDVSIEAKYAALVIGTPASLASGDAILGYVDLNTDSGTATVSSTNSEFSVNVPNGIFTAS